MSKLNETDIQGFVLRGYNMPVARYLFLQLKDASRGRTLVRRLLHEITTGQHWDGGKPQSTLNIAFTHRGLTALELPDATLLTFPVEFQQGMKKRAAILGDTGLNSPEHWDEVWQTESVHAWLGVNALSAEALETRCSAIAALLDETWGANHRRRAGCRVSHCQWKADHGRTLRIHRRLWQSRLSWLCAKLTTRPG